MAIANPLDCTTYAKDSTGEALPSQAAAAANEIIFSGDMSTNNNGNVVGPPTDGTESYVGRLVHLDKDGTKDQVRYIIAETGTGPVTCTVNEDWDSQPASGDAYAIPYGPTDMDSKGNAFKELLKRVTDWAAAAIIEVSSGGGFALLDGHSIETTDNGSTTQADIIVYSGGTLYVGFISGGKPVSGGYIVPTPSVDGEFAFDIQSGADAFLYDFFMSAVKNNLSKYNGTVIMRRAKIFKCSYSMDMTGVIEVYDSIIQGLDTSNDYIIVDGSTDIQELVLVAINGLQSPDDSSPDTITLKNTSFVNMTKYIRVYDEKKWKVVNPVWTVDIDSWDNIDFSGVATPNDEYVQELFSFDTLITTPAGAAIQTARVLIYEGTLAQNVPHYGATDSLGEYSVDILKREFTNPYMHTTTTTTSGTTPGIKPEVRGDFALHIYKHGYVPFVGALTVAEAINQPIGLSIDPAVDETTQATALSAGSGITIEKHGTGETDTRPMKALNYDQGTGSAPSVGETITQSTTGAAGVVVEYLGDATSGTLVLDGWNGTEFQDNDSYTLTGSSSSFSAKAHLTGTGSFYEEYTWEINCNSLSLQTVYDYLAAFMASDPATYSQILDIVAWGEDEQSQMLYSGASGYYTERNVNLTEGVWLRNRGGGTVAYFTADDGTPYIPAVQYAHTLTGLRPNTEVTYMQGTTEIFHVENVTASGETSYSYIYAGDVTVDILIHHECYEFIALEDVVLSNENASIPVQQRKDKNVTYLGRCTTTSTTSTTTTV
jgi:hypothetical protein